MPKLKPTIIIHNFKPAGLPFFDKEGEEMLGFYFQLTDEDENPVSEMIGPYHLDSDAEQAALRALQSNDF